jgi:hypothetical protein
MQRLLTIQRLRHRLVHFLGVEDVSGLVLAHPSLYEACLASPSVSSPMFWGLENQVFLPSLALALFPSLRRLDVSCGSYRDDVPNSFFEACSERNIAVHLDILQLHIPCRIPRRVALSANVLTLKCCNSPGIRCLFNGHIVSAMNFYCSLPDFSVFAAANPTLFECDVFPHHSVLDLSSADVPRSFLWVRQPTPLMVAVTNKKPVEVVAQLAQLAQLAAEWSRCVCVSTDALTSRRPEPALALAARAGNAPLVAALVPFEARVRFADSPMWTPLMCAAENGHADCVSLLIPHEAGLCDKSGRTALMVAAEHGHAECVSLLAQHEAGMADHQGRTARMVAIERGHAGCASLLKAKDGTRADSGG